MKKLLALTLAAVMTLALLAGCGGKDGGSTPDTNAPDTNAPAADGNTTAPDDSKPAASGSVYWLNFKPESDEVLQNVAKLYTEKTGVEVKVVTAAAGTYNQQLNAEMDKSNPPTLFVIGNQAGVKDWADYAVDLTGTAIANELNTDAYTSMTRPASWCPSATATSATASLSTPIWWRRPATPWTRLPTLTA